MMTMNTKLTTPVALLIFNRPEPTRRVFEMIRQAQPPILLVVADGPRSESERAVCLETRKIIEGVDWPCDVRRHYSDVNLGCKNRVSSGITWIFKEVDRAIILEDDCVPHPTFFPFCQELLEKYQNDPQVMHISGDNFQENNKGFVCNESYYFSNIPHIWGWASWRRAWNHYDLQMKSWPEARDRHLLNTILPDAANVERWTDKFQHYYDQQINSWDGPWSYACLVNHGLCIVPKVNLISNIGFGATATHTRQEAATDKLANLPTVAMDFPLRHPPTKALNDQAVNYIADYIFGVDRYRRLDWKLRIRAQKIFPGLYARIRKAFHHLRKT
jgi:hypothetical protein